MRADSEVNDHRPAALLGEPSALFRAGLRRNLELRGVDVVGEAADARALTRGLRQGEADVALLTLDLLVEAGGYELLRRLGRPAARPRVVVLVDEPGVVVRQVLRAGANGCVLKGSSPDEVAAAVVAAASDRCYVVPALSDDVVEGLRSGAAGEPDAGLTARELEVLRLVARGFDNAAIGEALHLSVSTVKGHLAAIQRRLGVENRVQAAVEGVRRGLA